MKININYMQNIDIIKPIIFDFINKINSNERILYLKDFTLIEHIVTPIPSKIILKNNQLIKKANYLLNKYIHPLLNKNNILNKWNICLTKNNFMFNFPFTLHNIIFMPLEYNINSNMDELLITFIHEQIHIYQRFNLKNWNDVITTNTKWRLCNNQSQTRKFKNCIYNPDTLYIEYTYCYYINNVMYYGYLDKNFKVNFITNNEKYINTYIHNYEHPFEEYAYKISKHLVSLQ